MKKIFTLLFVGVGISYAQQTLTLKPNATDGKDAISYLGYNQENVNYGSNVQFIASAWTVNGTEIYLRGFIDFDWSQIPSNAVISSVMLNLYAWNDQSGFGSHSTLSGSNEMSVEKITTQWDELTLTQNNMPTTSSINSFTTSATTSEDQNFSLDVTQIAQDIISDPTNGYGFAFKLQTEENYRKVNFCSSDHTDPTKWPELVITYSLSSLSENDFNIGISNPVEGKLTIKNANIENSKYSIVDLQGRKIKEGKLISNEIEVSDLLPSTYFIQIENSISKFIKL